MPMSQHAWFGGRKWGLGHEPAAVNLETHRQQMQQQLPEARVLYGWEAGGLIVHFFGELEMIIF